MNKNRKQFVIYQNINLREEHIPADVEKQQITFVAQKGLKIIKFKIFKIVKARFNCQIKDLLSNC